MSLWTHLRTPVIIQYPPEIASATLAVVLRWAGYAVSGILQPSMELANSAMETCMSFIFATGRASVPR